MAEKQSPETNPPGTGADANERAVLDYRFTLANERTFLGGGPVWL